jgi:hypothetical protein
MVTGGVVRSVAGLWSFSVKSMRGEQLEQAELTGKVLSATAPMRSSRWTRARW